MDEVTNLFNDYNRCPVCERRLPNNYSRKHCPSCTENEIFRQVREYIRENDVNEFDVSRKFNIPVRIIKGWIREGRIEYKDPKLNESTEDYYCHKCGAKLSFGTLCPKCLIDQNGDLYNLTYSLPKKDKKLNFLSITYRLPFYKVSRYNFYPIFLIFSSLHSLTI